MDYFVYKYVYMDTVIYVGKTDNIQRRVDEHASGQGLEEKFLPYLDGVDIYYHRCGNEVEMSALERLLINQYKPALNVKDVTAGDSTVYVDMDWQYYVASFGKRNYSISEEIAKCHKNITSNQTRIKNYEDEVWRLRQNMSALLPFYQYLNAHCDDFVQNHDGYFAFRKHEINPSDSVYIADFKVDKWYDDMEFENDITWVQLSGELMQKLFAVAHRTDWIERSMANIGQNRCQSILKKVANLRRSVNELRAKKAALEVKLHEEIC